MSKLNNIETNKKLIKDNRLSFAINGDDETTIKNLKEELCEYVALELINKIDTCKSQAEVEEKLAYWQNLLNPQAIFPISALENFNVPAVFQFVIDNLPEHPAYYPKDDTYTDRTERFIVSEMVREQIMTNYQNEIPYSTEVIVTSFKEEENIIRIEAEIIVERDSQKIIVIGTKGDKIKRVGTKSREAMEVFLGKKVFLSLFVKVIPDWRNKKNYLKGFGYES